MPNSERLDQIINRYTDPSLQGWGPALIYPNTVDLSPATVSLGDLVKAFQYDFTPLNVDIEYQRDLRQADKVVKGLKKTVEVTGVDGRIATHEVTIELGEMREGKEREYVINYEYKIGEAKVKISFNNRDYASTKVYPYQFATRITLENYPSLLEQRIENVTYRLSPNGYFDQFTGNGTEIRADGVEIQHHFLGNASTFPPNGEKYATAIPGVDLRIQKLDPRTSLVNLFQNINSQNPVNPLELLVFKPKARGRRLS